MDDEGQFECVVNGFYRASGLISIITRKEAILNGIRNYSIVMGIFAVLCIFSVICIQDVLKTPDKLNKEDKLAAFLEKQIMETRTAVKENIAKIVHGEEFEKRKKAVEQSVYSKVGVDGGKMRGNKDTVMTILQPPEV